MRYADDFKILCRTRSQAIKMYYAIKDFLQTRLHLEISEEKSKVVNLKKNSSEFLGFRLKHIRKGEEKNSLCSSLTYDKESKIQCTHKNKEAIKAIQKHPCAENVWH